jgi:hypothetical protein
MQVSHPRSSIENLLSAEIATITDPLARAIERERWRLTYAEPILEGVLAVLRFGEDGDPGQSYSSVSALSLARGLIQESVNQLDSTYIMPLRRGGVSSKEAKHQTAS